MTKHNHSTVEIVLNPLFRTLSVQLSANKMGMKPNCICVSVCVCVGVSSVWTVLHITIRSIVVSDVVGNGDGDGTGQCEHTINANLKSNMFTTATLADPRGCPSPPPDKNFLNFMQFWGKSGKFVCWRTLQGWHPLLQGILHPLLCPQMKFGARLCNRFEITLVS